LRFLLAAKGADVFIERACLRYKGRLSSNGTAFFGDSIPTCRSYFSLTTQEIIACDELIRQARTTLLSEDASIQGFNIGVNNGAAAGQTIFHCHLHLIPGASVI
jgi:hypothetical protein